MFAERASRQNAWVGRLGRSNPPAGRWKDVTAIDEGNAGGPPVFGLQGSLAPQSLHAVRRKGDGPDAIRLGRLLKNLLPGLRN
jgi:hypothetical protein